MKRIVLALAATSALLFTTGTALAHGPYRGGYCGPPRHAYWGGPGYRVGYRPGYAVGYGAPIFGYPAYGYPTPYYGGGSGFSFWIGR
jgi:hypothetical protein